MMMWSLDITVTSHCDELMVSRSILAFGCTEMRILLAPEEALFAKKSQWQR